MPRNSQHDQKILGAIRRYAKAYADLERLQKDEELDAYLPTYADQKTGMIGEYWAKRYAEARWPSAKVVFADSTSQSGYDLRAGRQYIQVKTVSAHSDTRRISPIKHPTRKPAKNQNHWHPWTLLWLVSLDENLRPNGFLEIKDAEIATWFDEEKKDALRSATMRDPETGKKGSYHFESFWENNRINEFLNRIGKP